MENKNLVMDYYQLTMAYSYFIQGKKDETAYFDMFYRKNPDKGGYVISAGLDEVVNYVKNFSFSESDIECLRNKGDFDEEFLTYLKDLKFTGDLYAVLDGTIVFPNEPLVTIKANIIEAQLLETAILLHKNFANLITTKASRIVSAAKGRGVMEFGSRRAHEVDAAVKGAKYAYVGGAVGTACVEAEKEFGVTALGTMAHSFIESFDSEYDAFLNYAIVYPNSSTFLVDTYDTLGSGVINAIKVAKDYLIPNGYRLKGIRLDSGDLNTLSKEARKMLDEAGLNDCKIVASNSLDEFSITRLIDEGACIDTFGVGENLITAKSDPVLGGVYKLVGIEKNNVFTPKIKLSETIAKVTNPGYKKVYRLFDENNMAVKDIIALNNEKINNGHELQEIIFSNGELVYDVPTINEVRENVKTNLAMFSEDIKSLTNPKVYDIELSKDLLSLKKELLLEHKKDLDLDQKKMIKSK